MRLLATSDWHLDVITSGVMRREEIEQAIDHSVQVARRERIDVYAMLGDLCNPDGWCSTWAQCKAIAVARELSEAGIASVWIAGNHDTIEDTLGSTTLSPIAATGFASAVFERPGVVEIAKTRIVGLPFTSKAFAYDPRKTIADLGASKLPTLVLAHLNLEGITPGSESLDMPRGREVFWPLAQLQSSQPQAVCLGGHYHRAQTFKGVEIVGALARIEHGEETNDPSMLILEV